MKKGLLSCLKYLNTELRLNVSDVNSRFDYWHALVAWLPAATLALPLEPFPGSLRQSTVAVAAARQPHDETFSIPSLSLATS